MLRPRHGSGDPTPGAAPDTPAAPHGSPLAGPPLAQVLAGLSPRQWALLVAQLLEEVESFADRFPLRYTERLHDLFAGEERPERRQVSRELVLERNRSCNDTGATGVKPPDQNTSLSEMILRFVKPPTKRLRCRSRGAQTLNRPQDCED